MRTSRFVCNAAYVHLGTKSRRSCVSRSPAFVQVSSVDAQVSEARSKRTAAIEGELKLKKRSTHEWNQPRLSAFQQPRPRASLPRGTGPCFVVVGRHGAAQQRFHDENRGERGPVFVVARARPGPGEQPVNICGGGCKRASRAFTSRLQYCLPLPRRSGPTPGSSILARYVASAKVTASARVLLHGSNWATKVCPYLTGRYSVRRSSRALSSSSFATVVTRTRFVSSAAFRRPNVATLEVHGGLHRPFCGQTSVVA